MGYPTPPHHRCEIRAAQRGSSPRERGTPQPDRRVSSRSRFIPARAGNTFRPRLRAGPIAVHPRASGEHPEAGAAPPPSGGSSPRERGTRRRRRGPSHRPRFIPARAGNTIATYAASIHTAVHPRASGEHKPRHSRDTIKSGSSPRERGTLADAMPDVRMRRFIPARAGNTHAR